MPAVERRANGPAGVAHGRATSEGHVWLRETGLHICKGYEPFVIEWPIDKIHVVEQA